MTYLITFCAFIVVAGLCWFYESQLSKANALNDELMATIDELSTELNKLDTQNKALLSQLWLHDKPQLKATHVLDQVNPFDVDW